MRYVAPRAVLPATFAYGLAAALGCAGAGIVDRHGRLVEPRHRGTAAGSASTPARRGTSSSGSAGTTGGGGTSSSGIAGTTGSGGSVGPGTAGTTGAAGTGAGGMSAGQRRHDRQRRRGGHDRQRQRGHDRRGGTGGICQMAQLEYVPKIPTVYLVVDRSGSMFHCLSHERARLLHQGRHVVDQAQDRHPDGGDAARDQVRFGFTTIFGTNPDRAADRARCDPRHARRQRHPEADERSRHQDQIRRPRTVAEPERRDEHRQEVRVAGDVRDHGGHQGAHGRHDARATSTSSSSPTDRRTSATTRSRSARPTPPSARCRPRSPRTSRRSSSVFRRRSSICPPASCRLSRTPARARRRCRALTAGLDHDRDLRPVPGRHAVAHRPDRVGPPDHARTDGDGGDVRDDGGSDQAVPSRTPPTQTMLVTQLSTGARGRQELHVRSQATSAARRSRSTRRS